MSRPARTHLILRTLVVATALGAIHLMPTASAQTVMNITAHESATDYWFEVEGMDGQNPNITLTPGASYTVHFANMGQQVHNLHFGGGIDAMTQILNAGQNETLNFTVPADASAASNYWCDPHRALGMEGVLAFETVPGTGGNGTGNGGNGTGNGGNGNQTGNGGESTDDTPGPASVFALATLAAAALAFRRRRTGDR